jgi:hypothetical protein
MADTAMESKDTPLQEKLEEMATRIGYFGFLFAFLTFIAMIVSWFADNSKLEADYTTSSYVTLWLSGCVVWSMLRRCVRASH